MAIAYTNQEAKPIVKWVGGKRQLIPELLKRFPVSFRNYHEPFVGGGALFFQVSQCRWTSDSYISDLNAYLIDTYIAIRDHVSEVLDILKSYIYEEAFYYSIRELDPDSLVLTERAARFIYLNKTGFNGLYRVNSKGKFNVPFGRHKNPTFCDEDNLRNCSDILKHARISCDHYRSVLKRAKKKDLIYFDPPYDPVSKTSNFTSYGKEGFGERDQRQLRDTFQELDDFGCYIILSNSCTAFIKNLYEDYQISRVYAKRSVNSRANSRGSVKELIVTNY